MLAAVLAEIGTDNVLTLVVGLVAGGVSVAGLFDKRRRDLTQTWKDLYEAKSTEVDEVKKQLDRLTAKVELLESGFIDSLATELRDAIRRDRL